MSPVEALIPLFAILSVFVFFPWIVLSFLSKRRESAAALAGDPQMNSRLQAIADRLEKRVQALETILDAEVPGWRKHDDRNTHRRDS